MEKKMTIKCVNQKCDVTNPQDKLGCVVVGMDGDFACSKKCEEEYHKQVDYFCGTVLTNDASYQNWLAGDDSWLEKY